MGEGAVGQGQVSRCEFSLIAKLFLLLTYQPPPDYFLAFGSGRFQCPGRWFALTEMTLFLAIVFSICDLERTHDSPAHPAPSTLHVVGVQEPAEPYNVTVSRHSN